MATGAKDKEASGLSLAKANTIAFKSGQSCRFRQSSCLKWDWWKNHCSSLLIDFLKCHFDLAIEWLASLPIALVVLVKSPGRYEKYLLLDGRLWAVAAAEETARLKTVCWVVERGSGRLLSQHDDLSQFPTMFQWPQLRRQQRRSLCELVGLKAGSFLDPQNLRELRQCLVDHCSGGDGSGSGGDDERGDAGVTVVQGKDRDVCFSNGCQFVVEAVTDPQFRIFYQEPVYIPVKPLRPPLMGTHQQQLEEECCSDGENEDLKVAEMFQTNRSSATSVRQSGLNLAFSLGVISHQELCSLSSQLGKTAASLALHLDERGHLRHIFYRDAELSFGQTVTCFDEEKGEKRYHDEAIENMHVFWQKVWTRRETWGVPARTKILNDVLARLERLSVSPCSSLFVKCLKDLKSCVSLQYVVFFSSCEDQIHSFKYYLAHFAHKVLQKKRGLQLKTSSDNNINALVVAGQMSVFNLQAYINAKDDAEFYGTERWVPPPAILHAVRDLHHQPRALPSSSKTVFSRVLSRARMMVFVALDFWTHFGQDSVDHFGVDLHGNGTAFRSASLLAFESVWTRFAHLGGPLVQGPEKIKPYYAEMLRSASRGGFMFSARTLINAGGGGGCRGGGGEERDDRGEWQSIMEFDLSSAYGFSASNALMPSGFCTGFVRLKKEKSVGENDDDEEEQKGESLVLEKTDPVRRHKSFEFKAVYFTLRNLMLLRDDIKTVYSNFSPLGLFSLDKYPADLTVIFANGQIHVYQFDGHFVHGCEVCLATSTSSETAVSTSRRKKYAHGQTHEQVRVKTNQRDKVFKEWASLLNASGGTAAARVEYFVVSDCHTKGYSSWSLNKAFQKDPVLRALILPYETVSHGLEKRKRRRKEEGEEAIECGDCSDLTLSSWLNFMKREESNKSFTCFAWLKGFCSSVSEVATLNPAADGCLIIHPPSLRRRRRQRNLDPRRHDGLNRNGCSLSTSATTEAVLLTRDYYQYLTSHHAFVVTDLDAVLFFKTEPIFNQIYQELIERRQLSSDPNKRNWTKRLVNLSCGFFGFQSETNGTAGGRCNYSIRHRIPRYFNISSHSVDLQHGLPCLEDDQYYVMSFVGCRSRLRVPSSVSFPANNALALFVTVVEMGKLRLVQALQFISRHVPPQNWSLLYSNVDNLIISLRGAKSLDEAVAAAVAASAAADVAGRGIDRSGDGGGGGGDDDDNDGYARFLAEKQSFLAADDNDGQEVQPGQLKLEWLCNSSSWEFITAGVQQYVLRDSSDRRPMFRQKTAGLSNLSNQKAFNYAFSLMFGKEPKVIVSQERRINKLQSMTKQCQNVSFSCRRDCPPPMPSVSPSRDDQQHLCDDD